MITKQKVNKTKVNDDSIFLNLHLRIEYTTHVYVT